MEYPNPYFVVEGQNLGFSNYTENTAQRKPVISCSVFSLISPANSLTQIIIENFITNSRKIRFLPKVGFLN